MVSRAKRTRVVIGTILIAVIAGLFTLDQLVTNRIAVASLTVVLALAGFLEYARIAGLRAGAGGGMLLIGLGAAAWHLGLAWWEARGGVAVPHGAEAGLVTMLCLGVALLVARGEYEKGFPALLSMALGVLLFGLALSWVLRIYLSGTPEAGLVRGVVFFLGVKGTDIVAYLVGSAIGRTHFLRVSPGKTLEGSLAAIVFGCAWFAGAAAVFPQYLFEWKEGLFLGAVLAITSSLGDLGESLIKRYHGVKDSGALLPEFGGVLDLIDSFVFSAILFWFLLA